MVREGIYFSNIHSGFKLSNEEEKEQEVIITWSEEFIANNQAYFDQHPSFKYFADHIVYKAHKGDQTVGRFPDGGNNLYIMNRPTIAQNNALHTYDEFIGVDDGVIVEMPDAIENILAENDKIDVRFSGTELIISSSAATAQLDIYSAAGQHQQSLKVNLESGNASGSVGNLPAGIYVVTVKGANGSKTSCKFMVK